MEHEAEPITSPCDDFFSLLADPSKTPCQLAWQVLEFEGLEGPLANPLFSWLASLPPPQAAGQGRGKEWRGGFCSAVSSSGLLAERQSTTGLVPVET